VISFCLTGRLEAEKQSFELQGEILLPNGEIDTDVRPRIFLQSITTIFYEQTVAARDWTFRFRAVEAGNYTLFVFAQGLGTFKKTVVVGASQADSKGRIRLSATLVPSSGSSAEVSAVALAIPKEASREYQEALECLGRQDREGAVHHLQKAVELAPHFADAWNRLGTISFKSGEYPEAERHFRKAIEEDPSSYPPLVNLGAALLSQNRLDDALKVNREAVKRQPEDPLAHAQLGGTYFALGELDLAKQHLKTAKGLDQAHFSSPQLLLAKIYAQLEQHALVIEELEEFLRIHPDHAYSAELKEVIERARRELKNSGGGASPEPEPE